MELTSELERLVDELGRPPTMEEFAQRSDVEPHLLANRFGNGLWLDALAILGYEPPRAQSGKEIPGRALQADLERVVAELGHVPSAAEYDDRGEYAAQTVGNRFGGGSWSDALEALGYGARGDLPRNAIPEGDLRADVRRVAEELGAPPTTREYTALGEYSVGTVANRLGDGSWMDALESVGCDGVHSRPGSKIPDARLEADLERVSDRLGRAPTQADYRDVGEFSASTVSARLGDGSWLAALDRLGLRGEDEG